MRDPVILFRALADETRLQMLILIRQHKELCVCDLQNVLEITQSKASRHLRYLLNAGLVKDRRNEVWIYYRISDHLSPAQMAVLKAVDTLMDSKKNAELNRKLAKWIRGKNCEVTKDKGVKKTKRTTVVYE